MKRGKLKASEEEWQKRAATVKKIYNSFDNLADRVSTLYISLKYMQQLNPVLSWNSEIFIQYFRQAVTLSISTPLFDEDDEEEPPPALLQSNFEFEQYNYGLANSRPTSALSFLSSITSNAQL